MCGHFTASEDFLVNVVRFILTSILYLLSWILTVGGFFYCLCTVFLFKHLKWPQEDSPKEEEVSTSESLNKTFCVETDILSFEETTTIYKKNPKIL